MATKNEQFFIDLGKGASWAAGVAFQRSNPLPLDKYSVFETEAKAIEYATTNAVAYPGQVVAYVDGDKMAVCVLAETADGSSLELQSIGGAIGDYETAQPNTLPQKKAVYDEDGETVVGYEVKWLPVSAIVEGDGNTTYTFAKKANDDKTLVITPYDEGIAGEATEISFAYLTADEVNNAIDAKVGVPVNGEEAATGLYALLAAETARAEAAEAALDAKIGKAAEGETAATGLYLAIANALAEAKKYADDNDANDNTTYSISYGEYEISEGVTKKAIKLAGSDNSASYVDVADFLKDSVLENVEYNAETDTLTFTWNTLDEEGNKITTDVILSDMIKPYSAGNGIEIANQVISAKLDNATETFLSVGENGLKLAGVQTAIDAAKDAAIEAAAGDATSKANAAKEAAIADAEGKLATALEGVDGKLADKADKSTTYTKDDVNGLIEEAKSAANTAVEGVQKNLDDYETANDAAVKANTDKLATIAEGAQVNVIEAVKVDNVALEITDKTVNIDLASAIASLATKEALAATDKNVTDLTGKVSTAEQNISALQGTASNQGERIGALETLTNDYATVKGNAADAITRIATAETTLTNLGGTVTGQGELIAGNTAEIQKLQAKDTSIDGQITAINEALANKVETSTLASYYTKEEINAKTGELGGKSIVTLIDEAKTAATYDDTGVKALIQGNTDAIAAEASRADTEEKRIVGLVEAEASRADTEEKRLAGLIGDNTAAIEKNVKDIAGNTAVINSILGNEDETDLNSIAELAAWIEEHGTDASEMAKAIEANTNNIKTINETTIPTAITTATGNAKTYTDDTIAALKLADTYEEKGTAASLIADYKVKNVDGTTLQLSDAGVASVKSISTDLLAQGTEEIIFNGGGAVL